MVANHLSRLTYNEDAHILQIGTVTPWYADIGNYLVTRTVPEELTCAQKTKIKSDAKYYV